MSEYRMTLPLNEEAVRNLRTGDVVYLSGRIFTARDMAHLRMVENYRQNAEQPKDFAGGAIFHAGPVALRSEAGGWRLNVIGPTTSIRMEPYADFVGALGVRALIGKGGMGDATLKACGEYGYVYLQAAPGCAAKLARGVERISGVTWLDMGMPEALWELETNSFGPLAVGMDTHGQSLYKKLREAAFAKIDTMYPLS